MEEDKKAAEERDPEAEIPIFTIPEPPKRRRPWWYILLALMTIAIWAAVGLFVATRTTDRESADEYHYSLHDGELVFFDFDFLILLSGQNDSVQFLVAVPKSIDRRQNVLEITYEPQPIDIYDEGENRYAEFLFTEPMEDIVVSISGEIELFGYDLASAREMKNPGDGGDLNRYLVSEQYLEKDSREIEAVARDIEGADDTDIVAGIFDYVVDNISYTGYNPGEVGAEEAIERGGGDCSEFSDILVALCRARDIPAKTTDGFIVQETVGGRDISTIKHCWAEVYLEEYGWGPFDPTLTDSGLATFDQLDPIFLRVSDIRNNDILNHGHFWAYHYWGDPIEVNESYNFTPR